MTRHDWDPLFYGGVLAHWTCARPDPNFSLRLDVAQVASPNKGADTKLWTVFEEKVHAHDFWMEPKYDLLVLFEAVGAPEESNKLLVRVRFTFTRGASFCLLHLCIEVHNFHLRTLSSNEARPNALCSAEGLMTWACVLLNLLGTGWLLTFRVIRTVLLYGTGRPGQIVGEYLGLFA
jgi:hypothetical protein